MRLHAVHWRIFFYLLPFFPLNLKWGIQLLSLNCVVLVKLDFLLINKTSQINPFNIVYHFVKMRRIVGMNCNLIIMEVKKSRMDGWYWLVMARTGRRCDLKKWCAVTFMRVVTDRSQWVTPELTSHLTCISSTASVLDPSWPDPTRPVSSNPTRNQQIRRCCIQCLFFIIQPSNNIYILLKYINHIKRK